MTAYEPIPSAAFSEVKNASRLSPIVRLGPMDDLEEALIASSAEVSKANYKFLCLLREFDLRQGYRAWGCNDCAEWLDFKLKMARKTALEKVRVARAIWFLPEVEGAFSRGELSFSQVRALTRIADKDNEAELLAYARTVSAEKLEAYCRRRKQGDEIQAKRQAKRDHDARAVTLYPHSGEIVVKLAHEAFALVEQVILKALEDLPQDETRTTEQARADALLSVLTERKAQAEGAQASDAYQVLVHVDAAALSEQGGESDLPLPTLKRLCCDGQVSAIAKDGDEVLNIGRKQRMVPNRMRKALMARDRSCRFPGCHHRNYLDAHHIHHWSEGGETSLDNLALLCTHHHKLIHEGGFQMRAAGDQFYFARPDGRPVERPSPAGDESLAEDAES